MKKIMMFLGILFIIAAPSLTLASTSTSTKTKAAVGFWGEVPKVSQISDETVTNQVFGRDSTDMKRAALPKTGEQSSVLLNLLGMILTILTVGLFFYRSKSYTKIG